MHYHLPMHAVLDLSVLSPWQVLMAPTSKKVGMKRANKKKPVDDKPSEDVCDAAADEPAPASPIRSPARCPNLPPPQSPAKLMRRDARLAAAKSGTGVAKANAKLMKHAAAFKTYSKVYLGKVEGVTRRTKRKIGAWEEHQQVLDLWDLECGKGSILLKGSLCMHACLECTIEHHENELEVRDLEIARLERLVRRLRRPKAPIRE